MSNKVKRKTPLKKTKLAKTFDYEGKLGIPNPYDKGKFGVKGNKKLLNVKTRKKYEKVKDLLRVLDLEADLGKQENFNQGGSKKNKKNQISKKIDKIMGFPMEKIDKLIQEAKELSKAKKYNKGGSNMAKKNFSSKELMMKSQYDQKNTKPKKKLADVSKEDMIKAGFSSFGKESLRKYLNMKNKLGRKPTKKDFETKKKSTTKTISSKANPLKKFTTPVKKQTKTKQGEQIKNMAQQKMTAEDNIGRQIAAAKGKSSMKLPTDTSSYQNLNKGGLPKLKKMNKGGVFKGIF